MMLNRKRELRTYERKTAKKPCINPALSPVILVKKYNPVENNCFDKSGICNDSLNNDPFETTFDRIAKGAVVPPIPLDTNENNSWKGSSSDSDINNSTNDIKSREHTALDPLTYDCLDTFGSSHSCTSKLTNRSIKITRKYKRLQKNKSKVVVYKGTVSKKTPVKDKIQIKKTQEQKRQRTQSKSKQSSRTCNKQTSRANSGNINNLEDTIHNNKHMHKSVLKIKNTSQTEVIKTNSSITAFKYTSNFQQNIKPCFVELDARTVQNYILDCEKAMGAKQDTLRDVKFPSTDTLHTEKDVSEGHNDISQSISIEYNNVVRSIEHMSIKECFVALYDNNKNQELKTEKYINGSVDAKNKSLVPHLTLHNLSASYNTNSVQLVPYDIKRNREELIKDSFVKIERLKEEEFVKKDGMVCRERERYIISSTPIGKCIRSSACSTSFSPININIDAQYPRLECSIPNVEEDISNIGLFDQKNSPSLIMPSKCYNFDAVNIHEHSTQILPTSQGKEEDIHTALTQNYNVECKVTSLPHSLNVSSVADTDKSLFSDTTHDYSSKSIEECKVQKTHFTNTPSMYLCLERINDNVNTVASPRYASSSKTSGDLDNITDTEYGSAMQERMRTSVRENSKDETVNSNKDSFLCESQGNVNNTALLARLQDSIRITGRRIRYLKWNLSVQSNISESSNDETAESNSKVFHCDAIDETRSIKSEVQNFERSKDEVKKSLDHVELLVDSTKSYDDANKRVEKSVFLKPGKCWARSLSILNHINDGSNLDKLSCGKGKRWRHSVRDILDMQKQDCKESPTRDNRIIRGYSTTARDVVLQRCSQDSYLPFFYCFPDSYLEHCRKIGEGVYGEVFLHEYLDKKSVIKIIPIEGEKLVNGEPQKKFNEILSEIVIAKELDNLRLNTMYKTSGFVEVRSIKCIMGKYPEKLVELWNTYDDNKTSDNDCPSMFDESQLYIALELCDGGEDLEAFVFQTAEEACALFLQTALALAVAEKALEFEHRDLHWGNVLISRTKEPYVCYNLDGKEIRLPSKGVKSNKWLMSAGILDMIKLTTTNTGLAFFKFRKRALSYDEYLIYLKDLAKSYNLNFEDMKHRMQTSGKPTTVHEDTKTT
ncbi:serine threonine-protein kinase haspin-like protein [Lasius niger]|uniref:Serine threonine-protein kinase haspin-like protein n=1 Tax=Lasius niger TaxID=67767 RepID=A0A0J7NUD9_LASNI|nr:serine threonine-protein kinase haspin-like protein [Lasius niger]